MIRAPRGSSTAGRHQRDPQLPGRLEHLPGPVEPVAEVLVVEDGDSAAAVLDHAGDLVEEPLAGVSLLTDPVERVCAVFADRQHGIDGQSLSALAEGLGDGRLDLDPVVAGHPPRHIDLGELVDIHRHHAEFLAGIHAASAEEVRLEEVLEDHVGVRPMPEAGQDGGDLDGHGFEA